MTPISKEVAVTEVNAWLDYKKVKASVREKRTDAIQLMVDSVMDGSISIKNEPYKYEQENLEGPVITQVLSFPMGSLAELKYKPRESTGNLSAAISSGNVVVGTAYASVLTNGVLPSQIAKMDTEDSKIMQAIVQFFL